MSITHAEKVATEEKEAARNEGLEPIPEHLLDLMAEYNKYNEQEAEAKREKGAIKELVDEELKKCNAKMFTLKGAKAFGYNSRNRTGINMERLEKDFGKEVIGGYIETTQGTAFYCKK